MVSKKNIEEKLSRKEIRELLKLCGTYFPFPLSILLEQEKLVKSTKKNRSMFGGQYLKKIKECRRIHSLFLKVTSSEEEYLAHWHIIKASQSEIGREYKHNDKPERKDNKTSINYGNGKSNMRDVRFPSEKRKTAWKRFYRIFSKS
jgi:hypothetical protein